MEDTGSLARPLRLRRRWSVLTVFVLLHHASSVWAKGGGARNSASSASGGGMGPGQTQCSYGGLSYADIISDVSPRSNQLRAAVSSLASRTSNISQRNFRCAWVAELSYNGQPSPVTNQLNDVGNGLIYFPQSYFALISPNITQLAPGGVLPNLDQTQLAGLNVDLMNYLGSQLNFTFTVDYLKLPTAIDAAADQNQRLDYAFSGAAGRSYDCVLSTAYSDGNATTRATFLTPHQPFGYLLVGGVTTQTAKDTGQVLFAWTDPFQSQIWGLIITAMVVATAIMYALEGFINEVDFGPIYNGPLHRFSDGLYHAFSNFCGAGGFTAHTPAGQVFVTAYSFSILLFQCAYTANLAAFFTNNIQAPTLLGSVYDYGQLGVSVCVPPDDWLQGVLFNNFPGVPFVTVPGSDLARLDAMLSGACGAALMPDYNADWSLGPAGDPLGYYCTFSPSGTIFNQNTLAIPFNANIFKSDIAAMNRQIALGLSLGDYTSLYQSNFPMGNRDAGCSVWLSEQAALTAAYALTPLDYKQLAGVFFLIVIGAGLAILHKCVHKLAEPLATSSCPTLCRGADADEGKEVDGVGDGTDGGASSSDKIPSTSPFSSQNGLATLAEDEVAIAAVTLSQHSPAAPLGRASTKRLPSDVGGGRGAFESAGVDVAFMQLVQRIREDTRAEVFPPAASPSALLLRAAMAKGLSAMGVLALRDAQGQQVGSIDFRLDSYEALCLQMQAMPGKPADRFKRACARVAGPAAVAQATAAAESARRAQEREVAALQARERDRDLRERANLAGPLQSGLRGGLGGQLRRLSGQRGPAPPGMARASGGGGNPLGRFSWGFFTRSPLISAIPSFAEGRPAPAPARDAGRGARERDPEAGAGDRDRREKGRPAALITRSDSNSMSDGGTSSAGPPRGSNGVSAGATWGDRSGNGRRG